MIPLIKPEVHDLESSIKLFRSVKSSGQLTNFGQLHLILEQRLNLITRRNCLPIVNGTAAIEIALKTVGLNKGSRILVPDFSHSGTILGVVRAGFTPVLCGVDPKTWVPDPEQVRKLAKDGEIAGAVIVSPFGYEIATKDFDAVAAETGIKIVYDFAGAITYYPETSWPVCYSFHATKNLGVGEGGMISFSDRKACDHARRLINFDTLPDRNIGSLEGANYKIDELKAAFLITEFSPVNYIRLESKIKRKRKLLSFYRDAIHESSTPDGHHYPSLCVLSLPRSLMIELDSERHGFCSKLYYPLLTKMPALKDVERVFQSPSEMESCLALPSDVKIGDAINISKIVSYYTSR